MMKALVTHACLLVAFRHDGRGLPSRKDGVIWAVLVVAAAIRLLRLAATGTMDWGEILVFVAVHAAVVRYGPVNLVPVVASYLLASSAMDTLVILTLTASSHALTQLAIVGTVLPPICAIRIYLVRKRGR